MPLLFAHELSHDTPQASLKNLVLITDGILYKIPLTQKSINAILLDLWYRPREVLYCFLIHAHLRLHDSIYIYGDSGLNF